MKIGIIALIASLVFISCQNEKKEKFKPITDSSVFVVYRSYPRGLTGANGKYSTHQIKSVDSNDKVIIKIDTTWELEILNFKDTVKGHDGKPILDSVTHQPKFNMQWYKLTPEENKTVRIQIINI